MRELADQMLEAVDRRAWSVDGNAGVFQVTLGGASIMFDTPAPAVSLSFERLAEAIEATIACERAQRMIEAVGAPEQKVPLWLVSGSDVLAAWLRWAGVGGALRKELSLNDAIGSAPVAGYLDRRARRDLGQGSARIRVRGGQAIAERIELSDRPRCIAVLGTEARLRVERSRLPETLITALQKDGQRNAGRPLAEVVSHPLFVAADLRVEGVENDGPDLAIDIESRWLPLEPVPEAALAMLPADCDPVFPWRATAGERRRLDGLVEEARHRVAVTHGPR